MGGGAAPPRQALRATATDSRPIARSSTPTIEQAGSQYRHFDPRTNRRLHRRLRAEIPGSGGRAETGCPRVSPDSYGGATPQLHFLNPPTQKIKAPRGK